MASENRKSQYAHACTENGYCRLQNRSTVHFGKVLTLDDNANGKAKGTDR